MTTDSTWTSWLNERFPRFALRDAHGQRRPRDDVARVLARMHGRPGALSRLAGIAFLLDPETRTHPFVVDDVPALLRRVLPSSVRHREERRGAAQGRIDWARTLDVRRRTHDRTWFVSARARRTFNVPALRMVRWLLGQVLTISRDVVPGARTPGQSWVGRVAEMELAGGVALAHAALRDLDSTLPGEIEESACAHSADPVLRNAAQLYSRHSRLVRRRDDDALADAVARYSLVPCDEAKRFELFTLLATIDALSSVLGRPPDVDELVTHDRDDVASWCVDGGNLRVFYDHAAAGGRHCDVLNHYFGIRASLRPDVRVSVERAGRVKDLLIDAKFSHEVSYMSDAHHKMLGYIADRPHAFVDGGPKSVVMCPLAVDGAPRDDDDVVFLSPLALDWSDNLTALLARWIRVA